MIDHSRAYVILAVAEVAFMLVSFSFRTDFLRGFMIGIGWGILIASTGLAIAGVI